tara:strand:+ start:266 stop:964 length:699 start_codon:yes stop_codon:yes gene_type:complete
MKIKYAMILAAGFGKRMRPLTSDTPKPLLKIGNESLLDRAINFLQKNGVEKIIINTHYLAEKIKKYISEKKFKVKILISDESNLLLDTGGGVKLGSKKFGNNPFFVINPDTLWTKNYHKELILLANLYLKYKKPCLLLVNKEFSFDKSFSGDFNLNKNYISKDTENKFIYTGLQIINRNYLNFMENKVFSMNEVWKKLIDEKKLIGLESKQNFYHINTVESYKRISSLNITF